jgi:hypothetical protein
MYEVWQLNTRSVCALPEKLVGVEWEQMEVNFEASHIKQDWTHLLISVGLPMSFV